MQAIKCADAQRPDDKSGVRYGLRSCRYQHHAAPSSIPEHHMPAHRAPLLLGGGALL